MKAFLDTHAAVLLHDAEVARFGAAAVDLLHRSALFCSPIVRLELALLREIGRLARSADEIMATLDTSFGVVLARDPIEAIVGAALPFDWTRDPFDRLIVGTAALHRAPLVTKDARIHEHFPGAVW